MKEIKSTIVGIFLMCIGTFFIYSDNVDITHEYVLYGCFGLIGFGVYLLFTTKESRKNHFSIFLNIAKKKAEK